MKRLSAVSRIRCLVAAGARELASPTTLSRDAAVGASNGAFRSDIDFFREDFSHLNVRLNRTLEWVASQPGSTSPLETAAQARLPSAASLRRDERRRACRRGVWRRR